MFGTVARLRVQPGREQEFLDHAEHWSRERGSTTGEVASYLIRVEEQPNEYLMVAIFRDRETYYQNAGDPETDRLYQEMRAMLTDDPEWNDGEVIPLPVVSGI